MGSGRPGNFRLRDVGFFPRAGVVESYVREALEQIRVLARNVGDDHVQVVVPFLVDTSDSLLQTYSRSNLVHNRSPLRDGSGG